MPGADNESHCITTVLKEPLFSIRGLKKKFPSGFCGANGIDLDIYESECILIAGPNGSGKTILMRMLSGLMEPSVGEIIFRGKPLSTWANVLRNNIGLVFQDADAQIIGETVEEDIKFGPQNLNVDKNEVNKRLEYVLAKLDLDKKRDFSPRRLSGGEKRRLAVAGILAMGCNIIIMDEPFANLDWPGVNQVRSIIEELKDQKKTIMILTHELEKVIDMADRLVILNQGKVEDSGIPCEVLDRLKTEWGVRDPRKPYRS